MKRSWMWAMLIVIVDGASCVALWELLDPPPALTSGFEVPVPTCQAVFEPTHGACACREGPVPSSATAPSMYVLQARDSCRNRASEAKCRVRPGDSVSEPHESCRHAGSGHTTPVRVEHGERTGDFSRASRWRWTSTRDLYDSQAQEPRRPIESYFASSRTGVARLVAR
jgi:hypothetical protein